MGAQGRIDLSGRNFSKISKFFEPRFFVRPHESCKSAVLDDPYSFCQTPTTAEQPMAVDETVTATPCRAVPSSPYSDEDRGQIIQLIRSLEGPNATEPRCEPTSPEPSSIEPTSPMSSVSNETLFEPDLFENDFDAFFSLN